MRRELIAKLDEKRRSEMPGMNRVAYVEMLLDDWLNGRLVTTKSLTTVNLFMTLFGDEKRMDELFEFLKGRVSENERIDTFLNALVRIERLKKKT